MSPSKSPSIGPNNTYKCPVCDNLLRKQGPAKGGKFPGQEYLRCHLCKWHYTFSGVIAKEPIPPPNNPKTVDRAESSTPPATLPEVEESWRQSLHALSAAVDYGYSEAMERSSTQAQQERLQIEEEIETERREEEAFQNPYMLSVPPAAVDYGYSEAMERSSTQAQQERLQIEEEIETERREEEAFQRVLQESCELCAISPSPPPASPPPPVASGSSSHVHQPLPSSRPATSFPITRVKASNMPTITTQMNSNWMHAYEDRSKLPVSRNRSGQADAELMQKFHVIWWETDSEPPTIFMVLDCPNWPKWRITDSPTVLDRLGADLHFFDIECRVWVECPVSYPHVMKTNGYLLLRWVGVTCMEFDAHLQLAIRKSPTSRVYLAKDLKLKEKQKAMEPVTSNSEVEIIEGPVPGSSKRNKPATVSTPSPPSKHRPNIVIPLKVPTVPAPDLSPSSKSSTAVTSRSPTPFASAPRKSPALSLPWYAGWYASDMVEAFQKMSSMKKNRSYEERFMAAFGQTPPPRSSYYDQVKRWSQAPEKVRADALAAGHTSEGLWVSFVKKISLRR
ncbi:hypothetical protein HYPSUDRAFT_208203 [Hypholoma sublateritium FD-334 SS-4]|uniref:Uncharacterized protein n=1 Tax=Hypholoma sublateritium (strain FD-334 SS-4) TaxID=945553 RepID=A0A0D2NED4_HYPSF|nr:hypothetical protein HYPSUDRAFT_208203 [Hypholoma sublateritium FD-334 SS-4]